MGYAIMRLKKHNNPRGVRRTYKHALRLQKVTNADSSKSYLNEYDVRIDVNDYVDKVLKLRKRKDAVLGIELMLTFSLSESEKEFFNKDRRSYEKFLSDWKDASVKWVERVFTKENVSFVALHRDETTPHLSCLVMPVHEGRLRAKPWLGNPAALSNLQDSYHEAVSNLVVELKRGIKGSRARHVRIQEFYQNLNDNVVDASVLKSGNIDEVERVIKKLLDKATYVDILQKKLDEREKQINILQSLLHDKNKKDKNKKDKKEVESEEVGYGYSSMGMGM